MTVSIILPARDESRGLAALLPDIKNKHPDAEIIVVDDGSRDDTSKVCGQHGVKIVRQLYSMGNGAAIKSAARVANGDILVFMDADGQHDPKDISRLLEGIHRGYDMVVGARGASSQANRARWLANAVYNRRPSWTSRIWLLPMRLDAVIGM